MSQAGSNGFSGADAKVARQRQGLTQFQVSVELGITPQHLSNYERGHSQLSPKVLFKLAQLLGLPLPDYDEPPRSRIDELGERLDALERDSAEIKLMLADLGAALAELKSVLPPRRPSR